MNRSLKELKFCFMAGLPLLCAARALDRVNVLLIEPALVQQQIFGRVVAFPWNYQSLVSRFDEDGLTMDWKYSLPAFPVPLKRCEPEDGPKPRNVADQNESCLLDLGLTYIHAGWNDGVLWVQEYPRHIDPGDPEPRVQ